MSKLQMTPEVSWVVQWRGLEDPSGEWNFYSEHRSRDLAMAEVGRVSARGGWIWDRCEMRILRKRSTFIEVERRSL